MSASDFREKAWEKLRGNWLKMALIMFIAALVNSKFGLDMLDYTTRTLTVDTPFGFVGNGGMLSINIPAGNAWLLKIIIFLLGVYALVIRSGCVKVSLGVMRGGKPVIKDLFLKGIFWKMLFMNIMRYIIVGFFTCLLTVPGIIIYLAYSMAGYLFFGYNIIRFFTYLLIVPGIIMGLAYSMADYLLIENLDMGPVEALRESRKRMKGYKGRYFGLVLSFAGWMILAAFVMGLVNRFLPFPGIVDSWISAVIASALTAYVRTASAAFQMHVYGENI